MKPVSLKPAALALALGMALAGLAAAQSKPTPAQQKELEAARADVERAAQHLGELASKYGEAGAPIRIERRVLRKPVIGVVLSPDDIAGVHIAAITPDSAAADAGLKSGDRIVSIDGKPINATSGSARLDQSRELLASMEAKTPVKLAYFRGGKHQTVVLTPKVSDRLMLISGMDSQANFDSDMRVFDLRDAQVKLITNEMTNDAPSPDQHIYLSGAIAPGVRREVIRLGGDCNGTDCKLPVLAEAFRWNGLNLASVDDGLGRYFGTTEGVLVLSTGKDLDGLQAGDVIQRIDGKAVKSPREAMELLRAQPAAAKVKVDYLRDRKTGSAQVTVPKALPFRIPPPPPKPPMPPMPPIPPAAPGAPHATEKHAMVFVDEHGNVTKWEGDANGMPPPPPPSGAKHVEERTMVFVEKNGKRTVINGNDAPPPPPPPPPKAPKTPPPPPAPPVPPSDD